MRNRLQRAGTLATLPMLSVLLGACVIPGWPFGGSGGSSGTPVVSSVTPDNGPAAGGASVTITGSDFSGATGVWFGSVETTDLNVVSSSEIVVPHVPASSSGDAVVVRVATPSATSSAKCFTMLAGCASGYYYMGGSSLDTTLPVNVSNLSVPIFGGGSVLVSATGGTIAVQGSLGVSRGAFGLPVAFLANGSVDVSHVSVTFAGNVSHTVLVPLPLGLPYGLDLYVRVVPSVTLPIPLKATLNANWTFSVGLVDGKAVSTSSTLTCPAGNASKDLAALPSCFSLGTEPLTLSGSQTAAVLSPVWLQVGPPGLNAGVGPSIGLSAGVDQASGAPYWEVCGGVQWSAQVVFVSHVGNLLGPYQVDGSPAGDPASHCVLGPVG
ncbi:MAG: IPT/TIG domain-containing protein [Acidimicrobiales bacterium]|nr:IPT/TIG domain-containing protein [Actinomycetota bacterium]